MMFLLITSFTGFFNWIIFETILYEAITCGNSDIVKYLISLEDFDIKSIEKKGIPNQSLF